jgi:hypothetical protein
LVLAVKIRWHWSVFRETATQLNFWLACANSLTGAGMMGGQSAFPVPDVYEAFDKDLDYNGNKEVGADERRNQNLLMINSGKSAGKERPSPGLTLHSGPGVKPLVNYKQSQVPLRK